MQYALHDFSGVNSNMAHSFGNPQAKSAGRANAAARSAAGASARRRGMYHSGYRRSGSVSGGVSSAGRSVAGPDSVSSSGSGRELRGGPATGRTTGRAASCGGASRATSHSQQSLQHPHLEQRWLSHASLVQRAQIRLDSSPQILHAKGIENHFFLAGLDGEAAGAVTRPRHR